MRTWPPRTSATDIAAIANPAPSTPRIITTTVGDISDTSLPLVSGDQGRRVGAMRSRGSISSSPASSQAPFQSHVTDSHPYPSLIQSHSQSLAVPGSDSSTHLTPRDLSGTGAAIGPGIGAGAGPGVSRPSSAEQETTQLFACPYTKYDLHRYSASNLQELNYRNCGHCYLTDISRLKQHLYRVHERPQHFCPTCFLTFKNQERCARHIVLRSCQPQPCPFDEKMTDAQLAVIKKKNRGTNPFVCWYDIYATLFPDAPRPASPYASFTSAATPQSLDLFMQYVQDRAPQRLRQHLGTNLTLDERTLITLEVSITTILRHLRQEFDLNMQTERTPVLLHPEEAEIRQHNSRKRKATDASLQVPVQPPYAVDAQSLGSVGDVSAPGSFSSTPALVDDDAEHFGRRKMASPRERFAMDMEARETMQNLLPDQMIRVVSHDLHWQHPETPSPSHMLQPEPSEWQMNMMTGMNLTTNMTQPGLNAVAPRQWLSPDGNIPWWPAEQ